MNLDHVEIGTIFNERPETLCDHWGSTTDHDAVTYTAPPRGSEVLSFDLGWVLAVAPNQDLWRWSQEHCGWRATGQISGMLSCQSFKDLSL